MGRAAGFHRPGPRARRRARRAVRVRLLATVALSVGGVLLTARDGRACTCVGPNPACRAFWVSSTVFTGDVVSIDAAPAETPRTSVPLRRVHLRTREVWSG